MARVIHNGKQYKFSLPYQGIKYLVTKYEPVPDKSGFTNENDLLVFIKHSNLDGIEEENLVYSGSGFTIEFDMEDARELVADLDAVALGTLTTENFDDKLDRLVNEVLSTED